MSYRKNFYTLTQLSSIDFSVSKGFLINDCSVTVRDGNLEGVYKGSCKYFDTCKIEEKGLEYILNPITSEISIHFKIELEVTGFSSHSETKALMKIMRSTIGKVQI